MAKIAIIGAGSITFGSTLLNDMFGTTALDGSTYVLMDPTKARMKSVEDYCRRVIAANNLNAEVTSTVDRAEALKDADYVIAILAIGGMEAYRQDYEIPLKYGIDQCIGQCVGVGGTFRGIRTIPAMVELMKDMEVHCPGAYLLNYVNPMASICIAMGRSSDIPFVGLCHGIQTTLDLIAGYTNVDKKDIDFLAAGINHMAWFLKLEKDGKDLYPLMRENCEKPEYYINDKVRCEVMRQFGYFMTESSGHLSEYLPWFRKNQKALDTYCDQPMFGGETGAAYKFHSSVAEKLENTDFLGQQPDELEPRSAEYCSHIIEAVETGETFQLNGNIINKGYITNLPDGCCVEVPVDVDKEGFHPIGVGDLPSPLAAMNQSNVTLQMLVAEAALTGDPELVVAAIAMDPLTSAVCTLKEIRDMTIELFEIQEQWLPQFKGKKPRKLHDIPTPPGTEGVPVPLDPALAVANRLTALGGAE
jgi:alpha-galactosidase